MLHQMTEMSKKKIIANLLNLQVGTLDHFLMLLVCCSKMEKRVLIEFLLRTKLDKERAARCITELVR